MTMTREDLLKPFIENKNVLDIGSVGQSDEYLFWDFLEKNCNTLTGIDLPAAKQTAKNLFSLNDSDLSHSKDTRIVFGNMETHSFNQKFDVIFAGDVIEHVSNQGLFLENIKKHLDLNGKLILTTPNAKWPTVFLKPNPTHVLWHDKFTLEILFRRVGFDITEIKYYFGNKPNYSLLKKLLVWKQSLFIVAVANKG